MERPGESDGLVSPDEIRAKFMVLDDGMFRPIIERFDEDMERVSASETERVRQVAPGARIRQPDDAIPQRNQRRGFEQRRDRGGHEAHAPEIAFRQTDHATTRSSLNSRTGLQRLAVITWA